MPPEPCHTAPEPAASCQTTPEPAVLCRAVPRRGSTLPRCTHPALAPLLCLLAGRAGSLPVGAEGQSRARCAGRQGSRQSRELGTTSTLADLVPALLPKPCAVSQCPRFPCISGGMVKGARWGLPSACCAPGRGQPVVANALLQSAYKCSGPAGGRSGGYRGRQRSGG